MTIPFPFRFALCLLAAILLLAPATSTAAEPLQRRVTVVGNATIKVIPDEMRWTIQITINDATLAKAKARHDASLAEALKLLKTFGGAVKDLQTGGIRFDKQTYFPDKADRSKPFSCTTQFTFTLTDFDKYGALVDGLAKLDGVETQGVNYAYSKEEATKRDALKQALINARDKANDLAVTAACYIDKPLIIQEGIAGDGPQPMMRMMALPPGGTPTPVAGKIEISAAVTATYDLYYR